MDQLKDLRPGGGFTLAPEAATERMREIINKPISTEQLLETVREIFAHGWTTIKLYFMIGHPSETLEDVAGHRRRVPGRVGGRPPARRRARARARRGEHLYPQAAHPLPMGLVRRGREDPRQTGPAARARCAAPGFKLTWIDPEITLHEAWLSRGDRRTGQVIYRAWQLGSKFDAWQEGFQFDPGCRPSRTAGSTRASTATASARWMKSCPGSTSAPPCAASYLKEEYQRSLDGEHPRRLPRPVLRLRHPARVQRPARHPAGRSLEMPAGQEPRPPKGGQSLAVGGAQ